MNSSSASPAAYNHDDVESDRDGSFVLRNDVTGVISREFSWDYSISGSRGDSLHTKIHEVSSGLAEVYETVVKQSKKLDKAVFAFFWLRFSRPTEGKRLPLISSCVQGIHAHFLQEEATLYLQRSANESPLNDDICQDLYNRRLNDGLLLR